MADETSWLRALAEVFVARPLSRLGVSRKQVMALRMAVGILAAGMLAAGPDFFSGAAPVFVLGIMLARADAALAPLPKEEGAAAGFFARASDVLSIALAFAGLGAGLQASAADLRITELGFPAPLILGVVAAVAVLIVSWLVQRLEVIDGRRAPEFAGLHGFDVADLALVIPFALLAGWVEGLLVVTAFGGAAFAGGIYMAHFRKFHHLT